MVVYIDKDCNDKDTTIIHTSLQHPKLNLLSCEIRFIFEIISRLVHFRDRSIILFEI